MILDQEFTISHPVCVFHPYRCNRISAFLSQGQNAKSSADFLSEYCSLLQPIQVVCLERLKNRCYSILEESLAPARETPFAVYKSHAKAMLVMQL